VARGWYRRTSAAQRAKVFGREISTRSKIWSRSASRVVVDRPDEIVRIGLHRHAAAQAGRRPIAPGDGICLLDGAVREENEAAHRAGVGEPVRGVDQRLEPFRQDLGVIVQKDDEFAQALGGPTVHPPPNPRFAAAVTIRTQGRDRSVTRCAADGPLATTMTS